MTKTENQNKRYDLEERTAKFGESAIVLCRSIKSDSITAPLINQFVRSSTSIGANYMEANCASSRRDFRNKIFICKKEAQETNHWLRMLKSAVPLKTTEIDLLLSEARQLLLIFQKIGSSLDKSV
jgi:four helix bundle protein